MVGLGSCLLASSFICATHAHELDVCDPSVPEIVIACVMGGNEELHRDLLHRVESESIGLSQYILDGFL